MVNELVLMKELEPPIDFTCADGTGIEKGAILKLTDPMTASLSTATDMLAGVAAEEKIASNGQTKIPVYLRGVFRAIASGNIVVGDAVTADTDGGNYVKQKAPALSGQKILGTALETAATGESLYILVNVHQSTVDTT